MPGSVIVGGARTPIGKLSGALKSFTAMDLGGFAIKAALERSGIGGDQVDYVIMGHVIQAGAGQITARQAAVKGGIAMSVPALTVNKVCLSGLNAIAMADQLIGAGEFDVVVAGGMESMTNGPYLLPGARAGYRYGDNKIVDATAHDALYCAFDLRGMGDSTEFYSKQKDLTREDQDAYSAQSHERALTARKNGLFDDEIVNVTVPQRRGDPFTVTDDEGVREGTTAASLAKLRPAFSADGTVTAGSASPDLRRRGRGGGDVAGEGRGAGRADPGRDRGARRRRRPGPVAAVAAVQRDPQGPRAGGEDARRRRPVRDQRGVRRGRVAVDARPGHRRHQRQRQRRRDLDGPPRRRVRGAVALHLALELGRRGGGLGAAGLCGGGGQGEALLLRVGRLDTPELDEERNSSMADMTGQVALVTGGIRGIGRAISERLAARGVTVAAGYSRARRPPRSSSPTTPGRQRAPGQHRLVEDCERVIQEVLDTHGKLDILVNNAGITLDKTVRKMTVEDWDRVIQVNLSGAFYLSRAILQHMLDRGSGRIINISSIIGEAGNIGQANYAASKSGLFGLTMSLAQETARKGITVNSVAPGYISTEMVQAVPEGGAGQGHRQDPGRPPRRARRDRPRRGVPRRPRLGVHHRPDLLGQRRPVHVRTTNPILMKPGYRCDQGRATALGFSDNRRS